MRVVCVGHLLIDVRFLVDRFPSTDEEAEILEESRGVGGSAANVAIGTRRLGLNSAILAKIGLDSFGRMALDELMKEGVDISGVRISLTKPTGFSIIARDASGSIVIYGFKGAAEDLGPRDIDLKVLKDANFVHIASLRVETALHVAIHSKEMGGLVLWDPGRVISRAGLEKLRGLIEKVDVLLANEKEVKNITGIANIERAAEILRKMGAQMIIVKRGERGSYIFHEDRRLKVPAFHVDKVVDTTGAGDAYASGLILALAKGYDVEEATKVASAVAALKVTKLGSHSIPSESELEEFLKRHDI